MFSNIRAKFSLPMKKINKEKKVRFPHFLSEGLEISYISDVETKNPKYNSTVVPFSLQVLRQARAKWLSVKDSCISNIQKCTILCVSGRKK